MKKTLLIVALLVLALAALGVGSVFAQGQQPPGSGFGRGMMWGGGYGPMHTYVVEALAAKLDLTVDEVNARLAKGETMYQIALAEGVAESEMATFLGGVHKEAFDKAVAAGALTREQADWMLQRMQYMWQNGFGPGNCPMHGGYYGQGGQFGPRRGGMWGGRWQTQSQ